MSLKKLRNHSYGYSNIDFRTKGNEEALKIYQPWIRPKDFGTMGHSGYKPKAESFCLLNFYQKQHHNPDPKVEEPMKFYNSNLIKPLLRQDFFNQRSGELEQTIKGKDIFTGDSEMIAEIMKNREKIRKLKYTKIQEKTEFKQRMEGNKSRILHKNLRI